MTPLESDRTMWEDLLVVLKRRKTTVLIVLLGVVFGTYFTLCCLTEQYEAVARLLVKLGRENVEVPITVEKGGVYTTGVQKEEINSYIQLLSSRTLIEAAVEQVGVARFALEPPEPETLLEQVKARVKAALRWSRSQVRLALIGLDLKAALTDRQRVIKLVQESLDIRRERDSNVIFVSLRLPDPNLASQTVETLIELYLQRHIEVQRDAEMREIFDGQTLVYRQQLEELQVEMMRIKEEWNLSSVTEQRSLLLDRLHQLKAEIDRNLSESTMLQSQQRVLGEQLKALPEVSVSSETIEPNPSIQSIKERIVELQLRRVDVASRYEEDTQLVKTIDEELSSLRALLDVEQVTQRGSVTYQPHPLTREFDREIETINVKLVGLDAAIAEGRRHAAAIEGELRQLNEGEDRLQMAELERRVVEQKYLANATRREEARIAEEMDLRRVANVAVLTGSTVGDEPVAPRKLLIMGVGLVAGLLAGVGVALLREWVSDVVYESRDLASIEGLQFLGEFRVRREVVA